MNSMPRKLSASWSYRMARAPSLMKSHFSARCRHMGTNCGAVDIVMAALRHPLGESDGHALPDTTRRTAGVNSSCLADVTREGGQEAVRRRAAGVWASAGRRAPHRSWPCRLRTWKPECAASAAGSPDIPTSPRRCWIPPPPTCREKKAAP